MSDETKREDEWEVLSSSEESTDVDYCPSDDIQLCELFTRFSLWSTGIFKKMEIMAGKNILVLVKTHSKF